MKKIFFLLGLLSIGCSQKSTYKSYEEYLGKTGLNSERLKDVINQKNCHASPERFFSCIEALNQALALAPEGWFMYLSTKEQRRGSSQPDFLKRVKITKKISWVKRNKKNKKKVRRDLGAGNTGDLYLKNWINYYKDGKRFPFGQVLRAIIKSNKKTKFKLAKNEQTFTIRVYNSYLESLIDPHAYLSVREYSRDYFQKPVKIYEGMGFTYRKEGPYFKLTRIIPNGPASRSDLKYGDLITAIKKEKFISLKNVSHKKINELFDSEEKKKATMLRVRRGDKEKIVRVERGEVEVQPLMSTVYSLSQKQRILVLKLESFFTRGFCDRVRKKVQTFQDYDKIIIDLRFNPGGASRSGRCLADIFLKKGITQEVVVELKNDFRELQKTKPAYSVRTKSSEKVIKPLVVLVNRKSKSASEIFAAAIQDNLRGVIVGERTYGKGTSLSRYRRHDEVPYMADREDLYLYQTKKLIYRPSGTLIEADGITPDLYLPQSLKEKGKLSKKSYNQFQRERFPWRFIRDFSYFEKWKPSQKNLSRNKLIEGCYQKLLKGKKSKLSSREGRVLAYEDDMALYESILVSSCLKS